MNEVEFSEAKNMGSFFGADLYMVVGVCKDTYKHKIMGFFITEEMKEDLTEGQLKEIINKNTETSKEKIIKEFSEGRRKYELGKGFVEVE